MDTGMSPFNGNHDSTQLVMNTSMGSNGPSPVSANNNNNNMNNISATTNNNAGVKACAACGGRICDRFLLHALDRYWHTGCLKCSCCQAQLGEIGTSCFHKAGMILCRNDYIRLFGSGGTCASCNQNIPANELVMRLQGNVYHLKCFTCMSCNCQLMPGDRFGVINGSLVCEQDYPKVLKGHGPLPTRTSHKVC